MNRPVWVTVVGILGIIVACFRIIGAGQTMIMPAIMDFQKGIFLSIENAPAKDANDAAAKKQITETFKNFYKMPDWYPKFCLITGVLSALAGGLYLFAAIGMLQLKMGALKIFYFAAGIFIFINAVRLVIMSMSLSFMMILMNFAGVFGMVIDIVLLVVVLQGNKAVFLTAREV